MADFSIVTGTMYGWLSSGLFWLIMAFVLTIGCLFLLFINKRRKLKFVALEFISFGNGKVGINQLKAGIFKRKSTLFGLWDYGFENSFKTNDGRIIQEGTSDDLQDVFGKKGFLLRRKDDDPKILIPISKIDWKNERALFDIAPADFRDASVNIVSDATKETQKWIDQYLPYIMLAGIVIFFIISMILATQFFNRTVDKAGEILLQAGTNAGNVAPASSGAS